MWIDKRSIPAGADWDAAIVEAIKASALVTVLVSPRAMGSKNVRQELRLALHDDKPVLPLLLEVTDFPAEVEYVLAGRQWVEVLAREPEKWFADVLGAARRVGLAK